MKKYLKITSLPLLLAAAFVFNTTEVYAAPVLTCNVSVLNLGSGNYRIRGTVSNRPTEDSTWSVVDVLDSMGGMGCGSGGFADVTCQYEKYFSPGSHWAEVLGQGGNITGDAEPCYERYDFNVSAPDCNSGISCGGPCTGAASNTCNTNNGTNTNCTYTTYSGGGSCNVVSAPNQPNSCTYNNCSGGYFCSGGSCVPSASAPSVTTNAESGVTSSAATLNGNVNPNGATTSAWFRWGTSNVACVSLPNITSSVTGINATQSFSSSLSSLNSGTIYYFCAVALNSQGPSYGSVRSFSTLSPTVSVTVSASPTSGTIPFSSNITASVGGTATGNIQYQFDCDNNGSYEYDFTSASGSEVRSCSYATPGTKTIRVRVTRQGVSSSNTTMVTALALGTIQVVSNLPTMWTINPGPYTNSPIASNFGEYTGVISGTYTITPLDVSGYTYAVTPAPSQVLNAGGGIVFTIEYTSIPGTETASQTVNIIPGHRYAWWVHTTIGASDSDPAYGVEFICLPPSIPSVGITCDDPTKTAFDASPCNVTMGDLAALKWCNAIGSPCAGADWCSITSSIPAGPSAIQNVTGGIPVSGLRIFRNATSYAYLGDQDFDYNNDGKADMAVYNPNSPFTWSIFGQAPQNYGVAGAVPVPGDYNGDGDTELAYWSSGTWTTQAGSFTKGAAGDIPVPGYYDSDPEIDVAVWTPSSGNWSIVSAEYTDTSIGQSGDIPVPADYNGDGKTDRAVWRPATGQWFVTPSIGSSYVFQWPLVGDVQATDIPVPADYDNNGTANYAVYRPSTGDWIISNPPNLSDYSRQWGGNAGDIPVPADYDGNGTVDIAVWRSSNGGWYIDGLVSSEVSVSPTIDTSYTLTCRNALGTNSASINFTFTNPLPEVGDASLGVSVENSNYCSVGVHATISGTYTDPAGADMSGYQILIDEFSSSDPNIDYAIMDPVFDSDFISAPAPDGGLFSYSVANCNSANLNQFPQRNCQMDWNTNYTSWARVRNTFNVWSPWVKMSTFCTNGSCSSIDNWRTPSNRPPDPEISILPTDPSVGIDVTFDDVNPLLTPTLSDGVASWSWNFGDGTGAGPFSGATITSAIKSGGYSAPGSYTAYLYVEDNAGITCSATKLISLQRALPRWREVAPRLID